MIKNTQYEPDLPWPYIADIRKNGGWSRYKYEALLEADRFMKSDERAAIKGKINKNRWYYKMKK